MNETFSEEERGDKTEEYFIDLVRKVQSRMNKRSVFDEHAKAIDELVMIQWTRDQMLEEKSAYLDWVKRAGDWAAERDQLITPRTRTIRSGTLGKVYFDVLERLVEIELTLENRA